MQRSRPLALILAVAMFIIAGCGNAGSPSRPSATAVENSNPAPTAAPSPSSATVAGAVPRPDNLPLDGTCEQGKACLGLLGPGSYQSDGFLSKFAFKIGQPGWENLAEEHDTFQLIPVDHPGDLLEVIRMPRILAQSGTPRPAAVGADVGSMTAWFAGDPSLTVTNPAKVTVGGLSGNVFDVAIAPGAMTNDPNCPVAVCRNFLMWGDPTAADWDGEWGLAGPEKLRLYLLSAKDGVVAIAVDSLDGATFEDLTQRASQVLATLKFD